MRQQNIVLFSSGVSEKNGILDFVKTELDKLEYQCSYWRDLFANARDSNNIALLPMLIKKIPTFDFAVLICEGHDQTKMLREDVDDAVPTMRDNVLFEIGLCTMALGPNRVILLTDKQVRIPDDLKGVDNQSAVEIIIYNPDDTDSYPAATKKIVEHFKQELAPLLKISVSDIDTYIKKEYSSLSPTVIGAAVSTANGYVSNFVLRTLEKINEGVLLEEDGFKKKRFFDDEDIYVHIVLPYEYSESTPSDSREAMNQLRKGYVPNARFRRAEFRYTLQGKELHIYDYPTTLVTGYQTARMILRIKADDETDSYAEKRFNAKELDLFENALKTLLQESYYIRETVKHFYADDTEEEEEALIQRLSSMMKRVKVERPENQQN